jgi:hypothetical protein
MGFSVSAVRDPFRLHNVLTGSGVYLDYLNGTGGSFYGVMQPERYADHSRPLSAEVKSGGSISPLLQTH